MADDDFAEKVRNFRKKMGWNQTDLAEALGLHLMTVSKWERGEIPNRGNQRRFEKLVFRHNKEQQNP